MEHGSGFLISYSPSGKWSAPLFLNWNSAQAGAVLGVEKVRRRRRTFGHSPSHVGLQRCTSAAPAVHTLGWAAQ